MNKLKYSILLFLIMLLIIIIPNISNAAVGVTREVTSNNGSMNFKFTGLTLDTTHEYEFGLTTTASATVENYYEITEFTASTATVKISTMTEAIRDTVNATDTGYITIKDKTTNAIVLNPYSVDLKIPYLLVTNYQVIENGKIFGTNMSDGIMVSSRNKSYCVAYYQYQKITDENIINKYKKIKSNNGDYTDLENVLTTTLPSGSWSQWNYFNGYGDLVEACGYGYPQETIKAPSSGLFYLWVYFSGDGIKDVYGYILVDNLEDDVSLDSISLSKTEKVELGKTLTLTPTFTPSNATNKIVTWSSSDESVATVDNAGKITPKKIGSTIITVTSQDGNKKATCTVTVTSATTSSDSDTTNNNSSSTDNSSQTDNSSSGANNSGSQTSTTSGTDTTTAPITTLPQTGISYGIIVAIVAIIGVGVVLFFKYRRMRDIV